MEGIFYLGMIVCIAVFGGLIGNKLKLPVGGMLGAMVVVIAFQLIVPLPISFPRELQIVLMLAFGGMIGSRITKKDMIDLKKLALPAIVMIVCMIILSITFGIVMYHFSEIDIPTALFATAPGGMVDMAIVSADFGANSGYVALLQLTRTMFVLVFMMPFYKKIGSKVSGVDSQLRDNITCSHEVGNMLPQSAKGDYKQSYRFSITIFCALLIGLPLWLLGIPAGAIIGAMLGSAGYNIFSGKAYFPSGLRLPLQILAGIFIGLRMDRESFFNLGGIIIPVLIIFFCVIIITFVTAFIIHKLTGLDLFTSLMASTPGGLAEMTILADDLGIDAPKVTVLHTARLMSVIIMFPMILAFVIHIM